MNAQRSNFARVVAGPAVLLASFLLGGCGAGGGTTLTASPPDWMAYSGKTITVRGNAGNSKQGPIVRFADGGYIPLLSREPWTFDERGRLIAGRAVQVTGRIVSGEGFRAEKYVLEVQSVDYHIADTEDAKAPAK